MIIHKGIIYVTFSIVITTGVLLLSIMTAYAHGTGSSFEQQDGDALIDIGYNTETFTEDSSVVFNFTMLDEDASPITFTDVWVRIVRDKSTVFATGVYNAKFGGATMTYRFPEAGQYTLSARFQNNGDSVAEATFPLEVEKGIADENHNSVILYGFFSFLLLIGYIFRKKFLGRSE
ncbi:hypothetical protein COB52_01775 [Candidatus Kaiserbacteria bacterium]|nr:MAG: hypothetical protein COB52_01775 [Candidatus Kaiserbacteria bacterium]